MKRLANQEIEKYRADPEINLASVWSESRGHNVPFVNIKYKDGCCKCSCKSKIKNSFKKVNISKVLLDVKRSWRPKVSSSEDSYFFVFNYLFKKELQG